MPGSEGTARRPIPWSIVVAVVVGVAVVAGGLVVLGLHTYCALGSPKATGELDTPLALVNAPYGGEAWANLSLAGPTFRFSSGSLTVLSDPWSGGATSGTLGFATEGSEPGGIGESLNWTVYTVHNVTGVFSPEGACTQPYVAVVGTGDASASTPFSLPLPNATTDLDERSTIPGAPSVEFSNGVDPALATYTTPQGSSIATYDPYWSALANCDGTVLPYTGDAQGTLQVPVTVPLSVGGIPIEATGVLSWSGGAGAPAAAYYHAALPGVWGYFSVGSPYPESPTEGSFAPPGLFSFSYAPCVAAG